MITNLRPDGIVQVDLADGEGLGFMMGPITIEITPQDGLILWEALKELGYTLPVQTLAPDNPTLSDWRVALTVWTLPDGRLRIDDVTERVNALVQNGHPMGRIAKERLEYANNVLRDQLMQLRPVTGFSAEEVEESLHRAERVRLGDMSGVWPLS